MKHCWKFEIMVTVISGTNRGVIDPQTVYIVGPDFVEAYLTAKDLAERHVSDKASGSTVAWLKSVEHQGDNVHVI